MNTTRAHTHGPHADTPPARIHTSRTHDGIMRARAHARLGTPVRAHTYMHTCDDLASGVFLAVKCLEAAERQQQYMRDVLHTHTPDGHGPAKELVKS